ncbi:alpha-ketoglutarate-dependent dioxygenase alkB homolog 3 isoform X9 [Myotis lucifugus]|uniref:alpha-ketoglutarate-dependent dioxygenase alkB homolog 3 isoform X9 n=1 Tax=Myotis lucifugus TaxID=59463 RepID=UPI000CCC2072|nr:alpha-ketoglutarate-dependent dioxygenase alkB homolog 3 isoform X9 [Myotis lucifugus]
MEDKRRRARVQGAWAGSAKSQAVAQPATTAKSHLRQSPGQTWTNKEHHLSDKQFVFKEPQQWHPVLRTLKNQIEENTGHTFNSLLCNLYRNEKDSVDWHSDDEPSLGRCPVIASLSFGATRTFEMRKKPPPQLFVLVWHLKQISVAADLLKAVPVPHIVVLTISPCAEMEENGDYTYVERVKIPLDHGTLLIMEGATQADWQHRVPKEYHSRAQRINLTFRTVYPDTRGAHQ